MLENSFQKRETIIKLSFNSSNINEKIDKKVEKNNCKTVQLLYLYGIL